MSKVIANISISLDGFAAGPDPTIEEPLGKGGEQLHDWMTKLAAWREKHGYDGGEGSTDNPDNEIAEEYSAKLGAVVMGRKMFSGGEGPWEKDSNAGGWWGDNPPFHAPVFILTNHEREKVMKEGGTTFTFVTSGVESAMAQAKAAAGGKDVLVAGGADAIQQCVRAGLVDELQIHIAPVLLGGGRRLLENLGDVKLEKLQVIDSPAVTHMKFRLVRDN